MTPVDLTIAALAQAFLLAALMGLVHTDRLRLAPTFAVYLAVVLGGETAYVWFDCFSWSWWLAKQTLYDAAKLALAVDLAWRICRDFPGAKAATARWHLAILLLTTLGLLLRPWRADFLLEATGELHARATVACLWLFVATFMAVRHYRLIVNPLHLGLMCAFGVYLGVWSLLLRGMAVRQWAWLDVWNRVDPIAYALTAAAFAYIAWRPARQATDDYEAVSALVRARVNG